MNKTEKWVCDILNQLLKEADTHVIAPLNNHTALTGKHGILDSLLFIRFITELELAIQRHINNPKFQLLTLELIDSNEKIFNNIESCSRYVKNLLDKTASLS